MGNNEEIVYDPMEIQLKDIEKLLGAEELSVADLVKRPEAVHLILRQQSVLLYELKARRSELSESQGACAQLRDERENLRIEIATLRARESDSLMDIPFSIVSGFAIGILVINFASAVGWVLLVVSLVLLAFRRKGQISSLWRSILPAKRRDHEEAN